MRENGIRGTEAEFTLALRPASTASRIARALITSVLEIRGLTGLIDDGALIATELVSNAARYADQMTMRVFLDADDVVIEIHDDSSEEPLPKNPDPEDVTGRGLMLVAACSTSWGWHPVSEGGKVTWARMRPEKKSE